MHRAGWRTGTTESGGASCRQPGGCWWGRSTAGVVGWGQGLSPCMQPESVLLQSVNEGKKVGWGTHLIGYT